MVVAAVLGWALVGDSLVLLIGVAPLVIVCGARSFGLLALRGQPLCGRVVRALAGRRGRGRRGRRDRPERADQGEWRLVLSAAVTQSTVPSAALPTNLGRDAGRTFWACSAPISSAPKLNDWLAVTAVHLIFAGLVAGALFLALRALRGTSSAAT